MCMLIHHSAKSHLSQKMLADMLSHNPDGFGFAYGTGKKVHVVKVPSPSLQTVYDLYAKYLRGREAMIHFRWRTHGDVDEQNTHPYEVTPGLWLAHNGVLSCVDQRDKRMSDTWHLIEDYLRPMLSKSPDLWLSPEFRTILGKFIGAQNKLAFVDARGKVALVNQASGITFQNTWFSNTYAWDAVKFGAVKEAPYKSRGSAYLVGSKAVYPADPVYPSRYMGSDRVEQRDDDAPRLSKRERKRQRRQTKLDLTRTANPNEYRWQNYVIDKNWLKKSFRNALETPEPLPGDASDAKTAEIAARLAAEELNLRRDH